MRWTGLERKRMNIYEKLSAIQSELKAPKGQYNSFGKYKYRSCEDILEALKPILAKYKCSLVLTDSVETVGAAGAERFYVRATATLFNREEESGTRFISNDAYAREDDTKKGMDGSQITGTASSYARKYALNGLFLIDDTKDADTDEFHETTTRGKHEQKSERKATYGQVQVLSQRYTGANLKHLLEVNHVSSIDELSMEKASELIQRLNSMQNEK
jgi:hypothetical protein